jgi:hypothetical protein
MIVARRSSGLERGIPGNEAAPDCVGLTRPRSTHHHLGHQNLEWIGRVAPREIPAVPVKPG